MRGVISLLLGVALLGCAVANAFVAVKFGYTFSALLSVACGVVSGLNFAVVIDSLIRE